MSKSLIAKLLFTLSAIAALLFLLSGYGYQWEIWSLGTAFTILRYAAYSTIGLLIANFVALFFIRSEGMTAVSMVMIALLLTGAAAGTALYWQQEASSVPPIHDITTDLENPPEFVSILPLREDAPNPPEYAGEETAQAQRESYPHLQTVRVQASAADVVRAAGRLVEKRGWELVALNEAEGRVEATEKLAWFGFKDDVVLRIREKSGATEIDMRSKSRIGRSDVGVNSKRIDSFLRDLQNELSQ